MSSKSKIMPPLHEADPRWVATLSSGMNWLVAGILGALIFTLVMLVFSARILMNLWDQRDTVELAAFEQVAPAWLNLASALSLTGLSIVFLIGSLRFTASEPGSREVPSLAMTRWSCVPAFAINIPASLALLASGHLAAAIFSLALKLIAITLLSVGFPASLIYMRYLANRLPDTSLAKQALIVFWGQFIAGVLLIGCLVVLLIVVIIAAERGTVADLGPSLLWIMAPGLITALLFFAWWVWLMIVYCKKLRDASRSANKRPPAQ